MTNCHHTIRTYRHSVAIYLAAVWLSTSFVGAQESQIKPLTDDMAISIIEKLASQKNPVDILTGRISVSHSLENKDDRKNRKISQNTLKLYPAFEKAGLLTIQQVADHTKEFTGWKNWHKLTQEGVGEEYMVTLTPRGIELNLVKEELDFARFRFQEVKIKKIISNEKLTRNFDHYTLVLCISKSEYTPEGIIIYEHLGHTLKSDYKLRVLFEYDRFTGNWKLLSCETAPINEEFESNIVRQLLGR